MRGLTFEFTRPAEAGVVSLACDDATAGTRWAYNACRSGSGVQRVVRRHLVLPADVAFQCSLASPSRLEGLVPERVGG